MVRVVAAAWVVLLAASAGGPAADEPGADEGRAIPEAFAPLEYLTGAWKGMAIPEANRLKGWRETHRWAWTFADGEPVGMSVAIEGGKVLDEAALSYDPAKKVYRLEGTDAEGQPVAYVGPFDPTISGLVLEREGKSPKGAERLTIRPNANQIRYTFRLDRREPGAPQYEKVLEAGVTKEGEAFAAGASTASVRKCIITGGAATLSVTFRGKTYPVCCTGCQEQFQDDPEKYVARAERRAAAAGAAPTPAPAAAPIADDFNRPTRHPAEPPAAGQDKDKPAAKGKARVAETDGEPEAREPEKKAPAKADKDKAKVARMLRLGRLLEKQGRTPGALNYYRDIVEDYPDSPEAKIAAERIKVLED